MTNDIDRAGVAKAYAAWAPVYDMVFGKVFDEGRKSTIALADAIGGCVLDVGVGTGLSLSDYSRSTRLHGVDISEPMLRKAQERVRAQNLTNVETLSVMDAKNLAFPDEAFDAVVAQYVITAVPDPEATLDDFMRVLKPGGELYFSDVFADRRIPATLRQDPVLLGECLAGALYGEDFRRLMASVGCADVRTVQTSVVPLYDPAIIAKIGMVRFSSVTVRAFKLALEDRCEDFGQIATYRGSIAHHPHAFDLDDHHHFETGRPLRVCGNSFAMLAHTRYAPHFDLHGDQSTHFGLFDCVPTVAAPAANCC